MDYMINIISMFSDTSLPTFFVNKEKNSPSLALLPKTGNIANYILFVAV
jgi:hypothetical protein